MWPLRSFSPRPELHMPGPPPESACGPLMLSGAAPRLPSPFLGSDYHGFQCVPGWHRLHLLGWRGWLERCQLLAWQPGTSEECASLCLVYLPIRKVGG